MAKACNEPVTAVLGWRWDEALRFLVVAQEVETDDEEARARMIAEALGR